MVWEIGALVVACAPAASQTADSTAPAGLPSDPAATLPTTGRADDVLFGDVTAEVAITLAPDAIATLPTEASGGSKKVPATVTWNGQSLYDVGLSLKGGNGSFRTIDQKPSFRLEFAKFVDHQRLDGDRSIVLNNLVQDRSMLGEHAAYFTWRALGVPACRHGYARVTVNGEPYGLYGVVEDVSKDFLERNWPDDAHGSLLSESGDLVPGDEDQFSVEAGDDKGPLKDTVNALDQASDEEWPTVLDTWFDTDALLDEWAVEVATGNPDAYATRHNNYFMYWRPADAKWSMIPWGPDLSFTAPLPLANVDGEPFHGQLYRRCTAIQACFDALESRLATVLDWMDRGELEAEMRDVADRTEADCLADPRSEAGPDGCTAGRDAFFAFMTQQPAQLRALLK